MLYRVVIYVRDGEVYAIQVIIYCVTVKYMLYRVVVCVRDGEVYAIQSRYLCA